MMWWYGPGLGGWGFALMTVGQVLFWALIILGLIAIVRYLRTAGDRPAQARPTPEELLADRFARGEIDEEDYQHRLDMLCGKPDRLIKPDRVEG
jgi:putative membrane protein